jgi:hypothetical protein
VGLKGETANRRAFATATRLETRPLTLLDIVSQLGLASTYLLATIAGMAALFDLFPVLDHLSTYFVTGTLGA